MRHAPCFSLHRNAAHMSTRSPFPGAFRGRGRGYGRRNFSDHPSSPAGTTAVSGDSHFQSVRDTNSSFQRNNNSRNFNHRYNNNNVRHLAMNRNPNTNNNQSQVRVRPADYRIWEFANHPPPSHSERFVVLSYNILGDYLANNHRKLYFHIPRRFMSWDWRKRNILFELGLWSPDIMCFQEVDKFHEFDEDLRHRGYSGIWKMRSGEPIDGCATFWRTSRFKLVYEESIEFYKLAMRNNVAQICVLESLNKNGKKLASSGSTENCNRVVVCNIHVLYNPGRGEIKLGQVRVLLERAQAISKKWDDASVILCGDFNCVPKSPLYNFLSEQKLDISELDRDKISGQASAEIRPSQPTQYDYHVRGQSTGSIASPIIDGPAVVPEEHVQKDISTSEQSTINCSHDKLSSSIGDSNKYIVDEDARDSCNTNDDQSDKGHRVPSSESVDVNMIGASGDMISNVVDGKAKPGPTNIYEARELNTSSFNDIGVKRNGLSLNETDKAAEDNDDVVEHAEAFMSELNNDKDAFPSDLGNLEDLSFTPESEVVSLKNPFYDPSGWTPMEIATATGNANSTALEHSLKLTSTYTEVEDRSGTRDSNGEPLVTSYHRCFMGTVDYIWRSEGLQTVKVLAPIPKDALLPTQGFPTKKWGSDHIALATELAFTK